MAVGNMNKQPNSSIRVENFINPNAEGGKPDWLSKHSPPATITSPFSSSSGVKQKAQY